MTNKGLHEKSATLLLCMLLSVDLTFVICHLVDFLYFFSVDNPLFSLENDAGYAEAFQYIKWLWIIFLLTYLTVTNKAASFFSWALFFIYLLVDDAAGVHEHFGGVFASYLTIQPPFGLRLQDLGELIVTGIAASILFSFVLLAYKFGLKDFRKVSHDMILLILALVFFGVFVDMLHMALRLGWYGNAALAVIEDGGEMVVASLICWYVFYLSVRETDESPSLANVLLEKIKIRKP